MKRQHTEKEASFYGAPHVSFYFALAEELRVIPQKNYMHEPVV